MFSELMGEEQFGRGAMFRFFAIPWKVFALGGELYLLTVRLLDENVWDAAWCVWLVAMCSELPHDLVLFGHGHG